MRKPYQDYKSIIWLRLDSIGDNILSSSMLPYIKEKFCSASITVVCQEHIAELYKECPFVEDIIITPFDARGGDSEKFGDISGRIKAKNPDLLLNSVFSLHYLSDLNGLDFIPERFAFRNERKDTYTDIVPDKGEWELELLKHQRFLLGLGIQSSLLQPKVWLSDDDISKAKFILKDVDVNKVIVLFAGVRTPERFYDGYWEALKGLDCFVIALGIKNDYNINQEQLDKSDCKYINLSGRLTLRESIAVIKLARLAVGGETGLAHAACAVGTANIVLLGGGHYRRFIPYSPLTIVIDNKMDCFRCNWFCKSGKDFVCVKEIKPLEIRKAIDRCLNR